MKAPTRYMQKQFNTHFQEGMEFWTGEDGDAVSFVVKRSDEGLRILKEYLKNNDIDFKARNLKGAFVYKEWVTAEEWGHATSIWRVSNGPTPFPVYDYNYF